VIVLAVTAALLLAACGGGDEGAATTTIAPAPLSPFGSGAPPPGTASQLPPAFTKCMADQGYPVRGSADIHSAPPQVLQLCFGALHQGG
jgi:hypothetical protein